MEPKKNPNEAKEEALVTFVKRTRSGEFAEVARIPYVRNERIEPMRLDFNCDEEYFYSIR